MSSHGGALRLKRLYWLLLALLANASWAATPPDDPTQAPPPGPLPAPPAPPTGLWRWFDPATAPFIPVPLVGVDPDSGTTLGLIPAWVHTDSNREINRIIAPDVLYNPYFGFGVHGRVYGYSSGDEQWSIVTGIKERVEREFDAEYQLGRLRDRRWSINAGLVYDRSGVPRFYGIGNDTPASAQTNYTNQQERVQVQVGLNVTHAWQLLYTARLQVVDVLPGTLNKIASIETRFGGLLGTNKQFLNRLSINYDTRNDLTVPTHGMLLIAYGGLASRNGLLNDSMYSEVGGDGRAYWPIGHDTILAGHVAIRFMPASHAVPFWALSGIGGGESIVGGEQPLRGFGSGRYVDRDSFSGSLELRRKVLTFDATSSRVDVEFTPFIDVGRVFARSGTFPLKQLHHVYGVGFRGIARPFVVGYVDIGYGSEGIAAFTGLNYPF
ncbi:MAG TPA: BamA/TamA family outer membrane protein [Steroidobacteraceae bacterium]|nr:BamA/TamA family outer membrane protein [Steroidobacteraceae bacterium]